MEGGGSEKARANSMFETRYGRKRKMREKTQGEARFGASYATRRDVDSIVIVGCGEEGEGGGEEGEEGV